MWKRVLCLLAALAAVLCPGTAPAETEQPGGVNAATILLYPGSRAFPGLLRENGTAREPGEENGGTEEKQEMRMTIGGTPVQVEWEENGSVEALRELARNGLTIRMSMYGGFEQVGRIGTQLPANDAQTVTASGDIVLYSGDQIVIFYGSNSWAYTRLGRITDRSEGEMRELLGNGDTVVVISAD